MKSSRRIFLSFCAALVLGTSAKAQGRPQRQKSGGKASPNPNDKNAAMLLPNFIGILKAIDKKFILIESEDGNEQKVTLIKKTKYLDGEKTIAWGDLKVGGKVSVEVKFAPDGSFDAVNIRVDRKN